MCFYCFVYYCIYVLNKCFDFTYFFVIYKCKEKTVRAYYCNILLIALIGQEIEQLNSQAIQWVFHMQSLIKLLLELLKYDFVT